MFDHLMPWAQRGATEEDVEGGLATISRATVDRRTVIGYDDHGQPIEDRVPSRVSAKFLHPDGSEVQIPLCNGRVASVESWEKYGRPHVRRLISTGFLPKIYCPLNAMMFGRVLVKAHADDPQEACKVIGPHGCAHYLRERDYRRAKAKADEATWNKPNPTDAMLKMAEATMAWATQARADREAAQAVAPPPVPRKRDG